MERDNSWGGAAVHGLASPLDEGSNEKEHNLHAYVRVCACVRACTRVQPYVSRVAVRGGVRGVAAVTFFQLGFCLLLGAVSSAFTAVVLRVFARSYRSIEVGAGGNVFE